MSRKQPDIFIRFGRRLHPWLYRFSGGRLGTRLLDMPVLLLYSIGRKTGNMQVRALSYVFDQGNYVLAASNGGADYHPDWWINLTAQPRVKIQVGTKEFNVKAHEAKGEERSRLWDRFVQMEKSYELYKERTKRRIPVIILNTEEDHSNK